MKESDNNNEDKMMKMLEVSETKKLNNNINDDNSDIYDNILENQIQKRAFLTNIPSNIENKQKLNELKHLKERKKSLIKKINLVKNKKNEMDKISFNNIEKAKIDNNMLNNDKKKINSLEQNLIDKLNEIKQQIKTLDKNEDENLKEKNKEKMILNKENKKFDESIIKQHFLNQNRIRLKEIENKYKNMQKELLDREKILEIKKEENLKIKKEEEIKLMRKRKNENEKKMEEIKKDIIPINHKNNLFQKMEQNFIEKEKKLIHDVTTQRKLKNIFYKQNIDLEAEKIDFQKHKNNLEERAKEQSENMKKLWHSRSMMLKPYQNSKNNKTFQIEEKIVVVENNKKQDRKKYSKDKVKLPPINEKLKEESEWRKIDIRNLKGKERINYIHKKYMQKGLKILNAFQNLDFGKKFILGKNKKAKSIETKKVGSISYSQSIHKKNIQNLFPRKNIIIPSNKTFEYNLIKKGKEKNQKEIKDLKKVKKREFNNWNGYLINKGIKEIDTDGLIVINKKIERLDEKVKLSQDLMRINGGYESDSKLAKEMNNNLVNSIRGKLAILDELYIDNSNNDE